MKLTIICSLIIISLVVSLPPPPPRAKPFQPPVKKEQGPTSLLSRFGSSMSGLEFLSFFRKNAPAIISNLTKQVQIVESVQKETIKNSPQLYNDNIQDIRLWSAQNILPYLEEYDSKLLMLSLGVPKAQTQEWKNLIFKKTQFMSWLRTKPTS